MDENQIALHIVTSLVVVPFLLKRWVSIDRSIKLLLSICSLALILLLTFGALVAAGVSMMGASIETLSPLFFALLKGTSVGFCLSFLMESHVDQITAINNSSKKDAVNRASS